MSIRSIFLALLFVCGSPLAAQPYSAEQLMAGVKAARPSGGIYARLRLEHHAAADAPKIVLQVQVKRRVADGGTSDHLYQLLYPANRKGEGVLLQTAKDRFSGSIYTAEGGIVPLKADDRNYGLFGTALTIDDVIAEFLNWPSQTLIGSEKVGQVPCHIVESKAPSGSKSVARVVRSWIDEKCFVTQKMEVFGSDPTKPLKTVLTDKVLRNKEGYYLPVSFTVVDEKTGARTSVEGTRSDSGIEYADAEFNADALTTLSAPKTR